MRGWYMPMQVSLYTSTFYCSLVGFGPNRLTNSITCWVVLFFLSCRTTWYRMMPNPENVPWSNNSLAILNLTWRRVVFLVVWCRLYVCLSLSKHWCARAVCEGCWCGCAANWTVFIVLSINTFKNCYNCNVVWFGGDCGGGLALMLTGPVCISNSYIFIISSSLICVS